MDLASASDAPAPANVRFADEAARAELADCLAVLADPAAHEGPTVVRVKQNASRTVWHCRLEGGDYYVKQYRRRLRDRLTGDDAARELRFSRRLARAGVPAVEVLAVGRSAKRAWMVSRTVPSATPGDAWHREHVESGDGLDRRAVRRAAEQLAEIVARMHDAGVVHRDLHVGNVLVAGDGDRSRLVVTDLHRMAARRRLSRRARAGNLALLLHDRRHLTTRSERLAFLRRYLEVSGVPGTLRGWRILVEHFGESWSRKQYRARARRVLGDNKYFTTLRGERGWRGHAVLASRRRPRSSAAAELQFTAEDWQTVLREPERLFDAADAVVVKDSPSSLIVRRSLVVGRQPVDVYIKRSRRKRPFKIVLDAFRPSRSLRAFRLGHELLTRRIATALPLAALERRVGPFLLDNILITEAVAPAEHLNRFLSRWLGGSLVQARGIDLARQQQLARDLLHQLGRLLRRLQSHGFAHRDLKGANLLVHWTQERAPEMVMVDLDGLSHHRRVSSRRMFQALMRLNVSLLESPAVNHAGRLRMLLGYLRRPGAGRINFKPYWRELEAWSAKKLKRQIASRRKRQKKIRR